MSKVVDIFSRKRGNPEKVEKHGNSQVNAASNEDAINIATANSTAAELNSFDFNSVARKNSELQDKMRKERLQANHKVLKSYKIK